MMFIILVIAVVIIVVIGLGVNRCLVWVNHVNIDRESRGWPELFDGTAEGSEEIIRHVQMLQTHQRIQPTHTHTHTVIIMTVTRRNNLLWSVSLTDRAAVGSCRRRWRASGVCGVCWFEQEAPRWGYSSSSTPAADEDHTPERGRRGTQMNITVTYSKWSESWQKHNDCERRTSWGTRVRWLKETFRYWRRSDRDDTSGRSQMKWACGETPH